MATLKLKFTIKGQGNYKDKVTLQCSVVGTSIRHNMLVEGLKEPFDLIDWNEDKGKFIDGENVVFNNSLLSKILNECTQLSQRGIYSSGKELFLDYKEFHLSTEIHVPTYFEWLDNFIEQEKSKSVGKSSNYQLYLTLKHKLQGIDAKNNKTFEAPKCNGKLIGSYLITELDTVCFRSFCKWILAEQHGKGFRNLCTTFIASLTKLYDQYPSLHFKEVKTSNWRSQIPKKINLSSKLTAVQKLNAVSSAIPVLTIKEIEKIENLDLNLIKTDSNKHNLFLLELYKDLALLVYYLSSRPADVLQLHSIRNLSMDDLKIIYVPFKLRNRGCKATIVNLNNDDAKSKIIRSMNDKALAIIRKYEHQSAGGYLLPFPLNEKDWESIDGEDYASWEIHRNDTLQQANAALKKFSKVLQLSVPNLTLYTFRHSSITHAINGGENWGVVAYRAGTSVKMIENHYYNPVK